ncbi:MAG: NUDIX hydrolase [Nitrososphaerales archaeon]
MSSIYGVSDAIKTLSSELVYNGRVVSLVKDVVLLPSGRKTIREKIIHPGAVGILPILKGENLILVEQFRYVINSTLLEIPAGTIEENEAPEECAARELREETGYQASKLELLSTFYLAPGYSTEFFWLFKASGLKRGKVKPMLDETIKVKKVKLAEAYDLIRRGVIRDAKSICAILLYIRMKRSKGDAQD